MKTILRPNVELLWFGEVDQGMKLEFNARIDGTSWPLAVIVADEADESLWLEVHMEKDRYVRIPLAMVEDAIRAAKIDVHSEAWYDRPSDV